MNEETYHTAAESNATPLSDPTMVPPPIALPLAAKAREPSYVELFIGIGLAWAFDIGINAVIGFIAGVAGAVQGKNFNEVFSGLMSMPWLVIPGSLLANVWAVLVCWYLLCKRYNRTIADGLALSRPNGFSLAIAFVIGIAGVVFATLILSSTEPSSDVPIVQLMESGGMGWFAVFAILIAPMEEVYYRGFLYPLLRRYIGIAGAIVLITLWFTAIHAFQLSGAYIALLPIFVMGLAWTCLRQLSGSLWPSILCHLTYNTGLVLFETLANIEL